MHVKAQPETEKAHRQQPSRLATMLTVLLIGTHHVVPARASVETEPRTVIVRPIPGVTSDFAAGIAAIGGDFVISGFTTTANGDDPMLVRVDSHGNEIWRRSIAGGGNGAFWSVRPLEDGSMIAAGWTRSEAGDVDPLVSRFSGDGELLWSRTYAGPEQERLWSIDVAGDELLVAGESAGNGGTRCRALVLRLDRDGTVSERKLHGVDPVERVFAIQSMGDGGYALAGMSGSGPRESAGYDARITRFDKRGQVAWTIKWGGSGFDVAHDLHRLPDDRLVVAGYGFAGSDRGNDAFLIALTAAGDLEWSKRYGNAGDDRAVHAEVLPDGGFALIGYSGDPAVDVDIVVRRTDALGTVLWERTFGGSSVELGRGIVGVPGGVIVAVGHSRSYGTQERILFMRVQQ